MMRRRNAVRAAKLAAILCAGLALTSCQYLRNALGVSKSPPNEFAVTTQPPLVLPPDLNLRPPQAGATARYALAASDQAKKVVFSDKPTAREAKAESYSDSEMFLLVQAIALNVDPGIRRTVLAEAKLYDKAPRFRDKGLPAAAPQLHVANFANTAKLADIGAPQPDETTGALSATASETPAGDAIPPAPVAGVSMLDAMAAIDIPIVPMPSLDDAKPAKVATNLDRPRKARPKTTATPSVARPPQTLFLRPAFER